MRIPFQMRNALAIVLLPPAALGLLAAVALASLWAGYMLLAESNL